LESVLLRLERAIWSWPLLILLLGSGLWLMLRLELLPLRKLPAAVRLLCKKRKRAVGRVSAVGALCTMLSASIGTGNMIGVATALSLGGPGALFWMELSALTGLSLKYAEGLLAVRYRVRDSEGRPSGGPFRYIVMGLGERYRLLALSFAGFGAAAGLCGVGTFVQVGSVSACLSALIAQTTGKLVLIRTPWGSQVPAAAVLVGLLFSCLAARVLFGGIQRISSVSAVLVPLMGGLYVLFCLVVLVRFHARIPAVLGEVLRGAFQPEAAGGGLLGTVMAGVSRGVFSNEAGIGTAPIAAASAEHVTPVEQGLLSMLTTVIDTMIVCTLTGLVLLVTDSEGLGIASVLTAFAKGLPFPPTASKYFVFSILALFAFTTVCGWSCFGTACLDFMTGNRGVLRKLYLLAYIATAAFAPLCTARAIWSAANVCNALMCVPNVTAILLLTNRIRSSSGEVLTGKSGNTILQ
jgi:AGCS family alanine or glycine:cation symporter